MLILSMMISEDCYVSGPNGELDWVVWEPEMDVAALKLLHRADIFIAGHKAFVDMAGYWPKIPDSAAASSEEKAFAKKLCTMPRAVVGSSTDAPIWNENAVLNPDDLRSEIRHLESEFGVVIAYGGVRTAQALIGADLIDELHLMISPISIGAGHRLFTSDEDMQRQFEVVQDQRFAKRLQRRHVGPIQGSLL